MAKLMRHRGPGRINFYTDKNCSLAQGMLNINRSRKNPYPIQNEDVSIFLICDGEIYTYIENAGTKRIRTETYLKSTNYIYYHPISIPTKL